jgi:hypothetical protein
MTTTPIASVALKLPRAQPELFLSLLIGELTLRARGHYRAGTESADGARLRTFNELQHRIAAQLVNHIAGRRGYPDRTFLQILSETAEHGQCAEDLRIAFEQATKKLGSTEDEGQGGA